MRAVLLRSTHTYICAHAHIRARICTVYTNIHCANIGTGTSERSSTKKHMPCMYVWATRIHWFPYVYDQGTCLTYTYEAHVLYVWSRHMPYMYICTSHVPYMYVWVTCLVCMYESIVYLHFHYVYVWVHIHSCIHEFIHLYIPSTHGTLQ
jgi:hypothetical protein